jgi:hypothetical protein
MKLLAAARQSPDFGVRMLAELSPSARAEALRCWTLSEPVVAAKPGLKKCGARPSPAGLGAQLQAFARTIGPVG